MFENFDWCIVWRNWRFHHRTHDEHSALWTWTAHYLYVGPFCAYWQSNFTNRSDVEISQEDWTP